MISTNIADIRGIEYNSIFDAYLHTSRNFAAHFAPCWIDFHLREVRALDSRNREIIHITPDTWT